MAVMKFSVPITKTDAAKQIVMGEVYVPLRLDSQGDFMTPEEIEKAAYSFMRKSAMERIDQEHNLVDSGAEVVESFIARDGDPDFIPGSWVLAVKCTDDLWSQVQKGEINGFSMYGKAHREERMIEVEIPDDGIVKGETYAQEDHTHRFYVEIGEDGSFIGGRTDEVDGHFHEIRKGTATEVAAGHSHRYSFLEALNEG